MYGTCTFINVYMTLCTNDLHVHVYLKKYLPEAMLIHTLPSGWDCWHTFLCTTMNICVMAGMGYMSCMYMYILVYTCMSRHVQLPPLFENTTNSNVQEFAHKRIIHSFPNLYEIPQLLFSFLMFIINSNVRMLFPGACVFSLYYMYRVPHQSSDAVKSSDHDPSVGSMNAISMPVPHKPRKTSTTLSSVYCTYTRNRVFVHVLLCSPFYHMNWDNACANSATLRCVYLGIKITNSNLVCRVWCKLLVERSFC